VLLFCSDCGNLREVEGEVEMHAADALGKPKVAGIWQIENSNL
jgi:hypothetical protein